MAHPRLDPPRAAGALVALASLVGLDGRHHLCAEGLLGRHGQPRKPHATRASVRMMNPATRMMSVTEVRCLRKGLRPMIGW